MPQTPLQSELSVHFNGSRLARAALTLAGWRFCFKGLPSKQGVLIGYPHTSNWDFVVMILVKWSIGLPVQFLAKHTLFQIPFFGRWLAWLGGVSIDRSSSQGVVANLLSLFKQHQTENRYLWLALSPEGTRRRTEGWRSGFYQLAMLAKVPLCMVRIDYGQKKVDLSNFMHLTGSEEADYAHIARVYEGVKGFHVSQAAPIQPIMPASLNPRTEK
jgi:1-acyl-sn-glycerol-3-phosphate acyltransferase